MGREGGRVEERLNSKNGSIFGDTGCGVTVSQASSQPAIQLLLIAMAYSSMWVFGKLDLRVWEEASGHLERTAQ